MGGRVQGGCGGKEPTRGTRGGTQELRGKEEISLETGTCSPLTLKFRTAVSPALQAAGVDTTNRGHLCHTLKVGKNFYNRDLVSRMHVFQAPTSHTVHIIMSP